MTPDLSVLERRSGRKSGDPCLRGTGIPLEAVVDRFVAGETIASIAEDYDFADAKMLATTIEQAIRVALWASMTSRGGLTAKARMRLRKAVRLER